MGIGPRGNFRESIIPLESPLSYNKSSQPAFDFFDESPHPDKFRAENTQADGNNEHSGTWREDHRPADQEDGRTVMATTTLFALRIFLSSS
jgi:hypothetical protein